MNIDAWAKEADWTSLYETVPIGTISTTDTYDLDDSIRVISRNPDDFIQIVTDTTTINYTLVDPSELKRYQNGKYCAKVGSSLKFNKAFTADDPEYGGTINVPAYTFADHLVKATDTVPIDDPNWLVQKTAADWVLTDITQKVNYDPLLAAANDLMAAMLKNNSPQRSVMPLRPVTTNMRSW